MAALESHPSYLGAYSWDVLLLSTNRRVRLLLLTFLDTDNPIFKSSKVLSELIEKINAKIIAKYFSHFVVFLECDQRFLSSSAHPLVIFIWRHLPIVWFSLHCRPAGLIPSL